MAPATRKSSAWSRSSFVPRTPSRAANAFATRRRRRRPIDRGPRPRIRRGGIRAEKAVRNDDVPDELSTLTGLFFSCGAIGRWVGFEAFVRDRLAADDGQAVGSVA